jgi:hypothetical protein
MARAPITRANPYTPKSGAAAGITFTSERQYRNALARSKGYGSWGKQQQEARTIRSREDVPSLRKSERDARSRSLDAVSRMRSEGLSLSQAARAAGTTSNAVRRYAGSALTQTPGGRFTVKASDRLVRPMRVPTPDGPITLDVRDSRSAALLARYWSAVGHYLSTGQTDGLQRLRGRSVTVNRQKYGLITDPSELDRLGDTGELAFDDIYDLIDRRSLEAA